MGDFTCQNPTDRALRQRDIVPPERLAGCRATIVGVGAIGRQVALQLAAMGVPSLQLIDHDTVEVVNLAPQGYLHGDLGQAKTEATARLCRLINPDLHMQVEGSRFRRSMAVGNVLFSCVDSMDARKLIWESLRTRVSFFADGRMSAEVIRILAVESPSAGVDDYRTTLFDESEAFLGACTAKSTIYTASIAAGLMLGQFTRWLRGLPVENDMLLNLLAGELVCT